MKYMEEKGLFCLYPNLPKKQAFISSWNEKGEHDPGLLCVAVGCGVLQCVAVCCGVLQCVVVCCGVLWCVAVCCSVSWNEKGEHDPGLFQVFCVL
jgi:hypothetical protein